MKTLAFQWISGKGGKKWISTLTPKNQNHLDNYIKLMEKKGHTLDETFTIKE